MLVNLKTEHQQIKNLEVEKQPSEEFRIRSWNGSIYTKSISSNVPLAEVNRLTEEKFNFSVKDWDIAKWEKNSCCLKALTIEFPDQLDAETFAELLAKAMKLHHVVVINNDYFKNKPFTTTGIALVNICSNDCLPTIAHVILLGNA